MPPWPQAGYDLGQRPFFRAACVEDGERQVGCSAALSPAMLHGDSALAQHDLRLSLWRVCAPPHPHTHAHTHARTQPYPSACGLSGRGAVSFACCVQACRYFVVYLQALKSVLASEFPYPSLEMIKNATPEAFKKHFPGRTIQEIIDAHEQEMQVPSCLVAQRSTWSKYKHRRTAKFLGGKISPLEVPLVFLNTTSFDSKTAAPPPTPRW